MKFNVAILDSDSLIYVSGHAIQKLDRETKQLVLEPVHHAYNILNTTIKEILKVSETENIELYLSGKNNFRYKIFNYYKENRYKCKEKCGNVHPYDCKKELGHELEGNKPVHYEDIKNFLISKWGAIVTEEQEADDICSIRQYELNSNAFSNKEECEYNTQSIIWHIDKDLNNVPGWHGNFKSGEVYYVTEIEAFRSFYLQILTGDASDNVPRIKKGWRQKDCEKEIKKAETEKEIIEIVKNEVYNILSEIHKNAYELVNKEIIWRGQLLWMRTKKNEMWTLPL